MRYGILITLAVSGLLAGATCFPIYDLDRQAFFGTDLTPSSSGTTLAISIISPSVDREVPLGAEIEINWTAANLTGSPAVATIKVRLREDFSETILAGGLRLPEAGGTRSLVWDTTDFQGGAYDIRARIEAGSQTAEAAAAGRITINTPPSFEFLDPNKPSELVQEEDPNDPNDPNAEPTIPTVTIRWKASDPDGDATAQIGIDANDPNQPNDPNHTSGNEIIIAQRDVPSTPGVESLEWDGTDLDGQRVAGDRYTLFAVVADELNGEQPVVEGLATITVPPEPNEPELIELAITDPNEDTTFLTSDESLSIKFSIGEDDDVLVDIEVDTDDNHRNGNEIPIESQILIETGTKDHSFDWDGEDVDDTGVDDGIYRIILVVNRGSGSPQIVEADHLVFRRSEEQQPLIALLKPDTDQTVEAGEFVLIEWRDDDPNESATIRLWLDDDGTPAPDEVAGETGEDQFEILPEPRDAAGDGVQDTFQYRVPNDLAPGRYYVFAYIEREGEADPDMISVAAGQIVIEDPEANNE